MENGKEASLRHVLFFSVEGLVVKIWLCQFWADFEKNAFSHNRQLYTVTRDGYEPGKANHWFGWCGLGAGGRPACVGLPRIKRS
jgi:hypothetical protein